MKAAGLVLERRKPFAETRRSSVSHLGVYAGNADTLNENIAMQTTEGGSLCKRSFDLNWRLRMEIAYPLLGRVSLSLLILSLLGFGRRLCLRLGLRGPSFSGFFLAVRGFTSRPCLDGFLVGGGAIPFLLSTPAQLGPWPLPGRPLGLWRGFGLSSSSEGGFLKTGGTSSMKGGCGGCCGGNSPGTTRTSTTGGCSCGLTPPGAKWW